MEGHPGSLGPLPRLVETWAEGTRDDDIGRVVQTFKDELRRQGYDIPCERKAEV